MNVLMVCGALMTLAALGGLCLIAHHRKTAVLLAVAALAGVALLIFGLRCIMEDLCSDVLWYQVKSGDTVLVVRTNSVIRLPNPIKTGAAVYYWTEAKMQLDDEPGKINVDLIR